MPAYWMITDRAIKNGVPTGDQGPLKYFVSDQGPLDNLNNWQNLSADAFQKLLAGAAALFRAWAQGEKKKQSLVIFLIPGKNTGWNEPPRRYQKLCNDL